MGEYNVKEEIQIGVLLLAVTAYGLVAAGAKTVVAVAAFGYELLNIAVDEATETLSSDRCVDHWENQ